MADLFLGGSIDPATHERSTADATGNVNVPTDSLTTHGVIVGMTGSGKTGLGVILIEEALRAGLPVLAIDPKGDLTNLCLTFPNLSPADFRPWIDEAQAANAGQTPDDFAASQAELWTGGLAKWGLSGTDIGALRTKTDFTIYTPGSQAGVPLDIVGSLQVPADMSDAEVVADEIEGYVTGLLGLVGIAADPLASREHILLSNLIHHSWSEGRALDLTTLVGMIPSPPIRKLGVFDVDQFFPADDRMALAMKLNGLLASPSFASWAMGSPLDIQSMLFTPDGRGRCAIVTTAHLSDDERQFVTSLLLSKLVTWMRRQSGTTDLRAMLYMDEVAGYLPPTEKPPTKKPIMTLMKQARAFGVGVILSTQNPVDLDYKAMSNAGTWMIGRLQTDRDKARLLDGMASAAGSVDVAAVDATISGLGKREFMLRRAGKDQPEIFTTRWAMSYLRGPMTRDQIAQVMVDATPPANPVFPDPTPTDRVATGVPSPVPSDPTPTDPLPADVTAVMPEVADGVAVRWVDVAAPWLGDVGGDSSGTIREAAIVARVAIRYDETKADLVHDEEYEAVLFPLGDHIDVTKLVQVDYDDRDLRTDAPAGASYRLPGREDRHQDVLHAGRTRPARSPHAQPHHRDPGQHRSQAVRPSRRDGRRVRRPLRVVRRRPRRRGDREAARQVRGEGDQAARPDRGRRGSRRRARGRGRLEAQLGAALDRRLVPGRPARRPQVEGQDARRCSRRRWHRSPPARHHQRGGESGRRRREQGGPPGRSARRTRRRCSCRHRRDRPEVGRPRRKAHDPRGGPGAHRREGHSARARLDPDRLKRPSAQEPSECDRRRITQVGAPSRRF